MQKTKANLLNVITGLCDAIESTRKNLTDAVFRESEIKRSLEMDRCHFITDGMVRGRNDLEKSAHLSLLTADKEDNLYAAALERARVESDLETYKDKRRAVEYAVRVMELYPDDEDKEEE